jgi:two-component system, chemotaxis family, chemotaxis protein CheY
MGILIVDDSKAMRMIVRRTLRMAGFHNDVTEASSGPEALNALQSAGFDLVLCDWNMPEMTGIEFLQKLRSEGRQDKVGFVTSESSDDARATAQQAGALFLISKPFTPEAFRSTLGPILGR